MFYQRWLCPTGYLGITIKYPIRLQGSNMDHPPTNIVTFLFTDIEGNTRIAQKFPVVCETGCRLSLKEAVDQILPGDSP